MNTRGYSDINPETMLGGYHVGSGTMHAGAGHHAGLGGELSGRRLQGTHNPEIREKQGCSLLSLSPYD